MLRIDALEAIYPQLEDCVVVTIMGAVSAELQSLGHRPNFFYLLARHGTRFFDGARHRLEPPGTAGGGARRRRLDPDEPRQPDHDGPLPAQRTWFTSSSTTRVSSRSAASRPRPRPAATSPGMAASAGVPHTSTVRTIDAFKEAFSTALRTRGPDHDRRQSRREGSAGLPDRPADAGESLSVSAASARHSRPRGFDE